MRRRKNKSKDTTAPSYSDMARDLARLSTIRAKLSSPLRMHKVYPILLDACYWVACLFKNEKVLDTVFFVWLMLREALYVLATVWLRLFLIILFNAIAIFLLVMGVFYLLK